MKNQPALFPLAPSTRRIYLCARISSGFVILSKHDTAADGAKALEARRAHNVGRDAIEMLSLLAGHDTCTVAHNIREFDFFFELTTDEAAEVVNVYCG